MPTMNHIHTLYQAAYYFSKGCSITAEKEVLSKVYGRHTLRTYLTRIVADMKTLKKRSLVALYKRWKTTFGEDLAITLNQLVTLTKTIKSKKIKKATPTPVAPSGLAPVATESVLNTEEAKEVEDWDPFKETQPEVPFKFTEDLNDIPTPLYVPSPVKEVNTQEVSLRVKTSEKPTTLLSILHEASKRPTTLPIWKKMVANLKSHQMLNMLLLEQVEDQKIVDHLLAQGPVVVGCQPCVVPCLDQSRESQEDPESAIRAITTVPEYFTKMYEEQTETVDYNEFEDDDDDDLFKEPEPEKPKEPIRVPVVQQAIPADLEDRMMEPMNHVVTPTFQWPSKIQEQTNDRLLRGIDVAIQNSRSLSVPLIIQGTAYLDSIYLRSNLLEVGLRRYFRQQCRKLEELNEVFIVEPIDVPEVPVDYTRLEDVPFQPPCPTSPTYEHFSPPPPERSPSGDILVPLAREPPIIEPLMLVPVIAPSIMLATPEARTQVRLGREPQRTPPKLKAAAEPKLEKTFKDEDKQMLGRSPAKKSYRLHWPENKDDRLGMYTKMFLDYAGCLPTDIMFLIISHIGLVKNKNQTWVEPVDTTYWRGRYHYWRTELDSVMQSAGYELPGLGYYGDDRDFLNCFQIEMKHINDECYRMKFVMEEEWKKLKYICYENLISQEIKLEEYIKRFKHVVEKLRKRFKNVKKDQSKLLAMAEPVLEKEHKDDEKPDPVVSGCKIILGNQEQYMEENNLSDSDFEPDEENIDLVGGMRPFIPNIHAKKNKKQRRLTPEEEARRQMEDRQRVAELRRIESMQELEEPTNQPTTYFSSDLYSPLYPLGIAGFRDTDIQAVARRKRRQEELRIGLRRGRPLQVPRSRNRPPTEEDQYVPVSPQRTPPAPEPSISPRFPRLPPSRPLPTLPERKVPEEEEEFDPFAILTPPEEEKKIEIVRRPGPAVNPFAEILDPYHQIHGRLFDTAEEAVDDFENEYQPGGWTVSLGKGLGKPITYVENPVTGRYEVPEKGKGGRPKKFGPKNKPQLGGRPKNVIRRKVFKVNALGQLEETEIVEPVIGRTEFAKRARQLERGVEQMIRNKRQKPSQRVMERAVGLNIPGLSDQLTQVYKRTIKIRAGQKLTYFGFKFDPIKQIAQGPDFAISEFATSTLLGPLRMFQRQNQNLRDFIERAMDRQITMWRFIIIYSTGFAQQITSTPWTGTYDRAFNAAQAKIAMLIARYGDENVVIDRYEVKVRVIRGQQVLAGGKNTILDNKLKGLDTKWVVINPKSKTNCLWTSVAIATGFEACPELIYNKKVQNRAGVNLKRKVGTRNEKGGTEEDLRKCSIHKSVEIIVHNQQDEIIATITPTNPATTIHLLLNLGHYHALLPADNEKVASNKSQICEQEPRALNMIKKCNKEFEARRIVAYDLESYRKPLQEVNDIWMEIDQIAYAIGWAVEVRNPEEYQEMEEKGYEIIDCDPMIPFVAYKRLLGPDCLNEALDEWLHNPIYDQAVFYGHNAGKFDIRLILGQSNLLYDSQYVIVADKVIELNSRLINLDVQNLFVTYKNEEEKTRFHQISLRDSLPLFGPDSKLAKLTTELNVPHKKMEEKVNVHELQTAETWEDNWQKYEMDLYLRNDVLGLLEVLHQFNQEVEVATSIPITAVNTGASLAKKYYLKHYYNNVNETSNAKDPLLSIYTLDREMDNFLRMGYGGGRCEAFRCGEINQPVYYYDFTSLYPDVGRLNMPIGQPKWLCEPGSEDPEIINSTWKQRVLDRNTFGQTAFWKLRVRSPLAAAGTPMDPLKHKPLFGMKEEGMYIFRWYAEWTEMVVYEEELKFAIDLGLDYEYEPMNGILFQHEQVLKECMEDLFKKKAQAKEEGKPGLSKTWKIIINSLYGVWGLKVLDREGIEIARPEHSNWAVDLATEKLMDIEKIGRYIVSRRIRDLEVKDCNVALAAAVTAEARMKLYRLIQDLQDRGGEILYCDTDSIITTYHIEGDREMKEKWIGPSEGKDLGSLKNEIEECYEKLRKKHPTIQMKDHFDKCIIVAPKLYIVTAEQENIVKKAHKGYREDGEKGDIVNYQRMKVLVDQDLPECQRILEQDTIQWIGGNGDLLKNNIGVRLVKRHKVIQGLCADGHPINKGMLNEVGQVVPFTMKTERRKRQKRKMDIEP